MSEKKAKRRQLLIDRPVQLGMVKRIVFHWVMFLASVVVILPLYKAIMMGDLTTPMATRMHQAGVEALILLTLFGALLPYFAYDMFRTTNRFAGPMFRLQQTIRGLARGDAYRPLKFRDGDFWHSVADDFNTMVGRLKEKPAPQSEVVEEEPVAVG